VKNDNDEIIEYGEEDYENPKDLRKYKEKVKEKVKSFVKNKVKKQTFDLPDNSTLTTKIKPKLGKKTKISLEWNKQFKDDNVEIFVRINGQPIVCLEDGFRTEDADSFSAEFGATKRF